jgi:sulfur relay protein TusB/DsrH
MTETVLFMTSKNGRSLERLLATAGTILESGNTVRILLFGDAVLATVSESMEAESLQLFSEVEMFACREDLESRGLLQKTNPSVRVLDYDGIVDLIMLDDCKVANYG